MVDGPLPIIPETKDINKQYSVIYPEGEIIYNITFEIIPEEKIIKISINNTDSRINKIYSRSLSLEDWNKLAPDPNIFKDISDIFQKLEKIEKENCILKFHEYSVDLDIKLPNYHYNSMIISLIEVKKENLNHNKIIEDNLNLNKENKRLEERVKNLEKEIEILKLNLPNYIDKKLFQKIIQSSKIIKEQEQLEIINRGINNLFHKNIKDIIFKYEFKDQDKDNSLSSFISNYQNLTNVLIIVKTTEFRSFGAFYQKQSFPDLINYNQNYYQNDYSTYSQGYGCNYLTFDPKQYPNTFFFSLDNLKIYNWNNSQNNLYENPSFIISFDNNRKRFCGTEKKNNNNINFEAIIQNLQNKLSEFEKKINEMETKIQNISSSNNQIRVATISQYNPAPSIKYGQSFLQQNNTSTTTMNIQSHTINNINIQNINQTQIDYSFVLSNQERFENFYLEIYEVKI